MLLQGQEDLIRCQAQRQPWVGNDKLEKINAYIPADISAADSGTCSATAANPRVVANVNGIANLGVLTA